MKLSSINFAKYNITNNYIYCCHNTTQHNTTLHYTTQHYTYIVEHNLKIIEGR